MIEAASEANLLNIGGQLQFIPPQIGVCECYWIEVDTNKTVSAKLPWNKRVQLSAESALAQFKKLKATKDFTKEGRDAFTQLVDIDLEQTMCFVWYLSTDSEQQELDSKILKLKPRPKCGWF